MAIADVDLVADLRGRPRRRHGMRDRALADQRRDGADRLGLRAGEGRQADQQRDDHHDMSHEDDRPHTQCQTANWPILRVSGRRQHNGPVKSVTGDW
jgi:hypothetical protein